MQNCFIVSVLQHGCREKPGNGWGIKRFSCALLLNVPLNSGLFILIQMSKIAMQQQALGQLQAGLVDELETKGTFQDPETQKIMESYHKVMISLMGEDTVNLASQAYDLTQFHKRFSICF